MALLQPPVWVDGTDTPARTLRMLTRGLTRENEGIEQGDDLKVAQLATAGAAVQVADGAALITGKSTRWQGAYHSYNVGSANVAIAPTGAAARTDLIVLRVMDPEYEAPLTAGEYASFQVVSGVSAGQTTVPNPAWTAIPLARVTIPANTSAITNAMITDLRRIANARRERSLFVAGQATIQDLTASAWTNWPNVSFTVSVPSWATTAKVRMDVAGAKLITSDWVGNARTLLGALPSQTVAVNVDWPGSAVRANLLAGDTLTIDASLRGTSQALRFQAQRVGGTGGLRADTSTTVFADIEFTEGLR